MPIEKVEKITFGILNEEGIIILPHKSGACAFIGNAGRSQYLTHRKAKRLLEQAEEISLEDYVDRFTSLKFEYEYIRLIRKKDLKEDEKKRLSILIKIINFFIETPPYPAWYYGLDDGSDPCVKVQNEILGLCATSVNSLHQFFQSNHSFVYISKKQFEDLSKGKKEAFEFKEYPPGKILREYYQLGSLLYDDLANERINDSVQQDFFERVVPPDMKVEEGTKEDNTALEKYYQYLVNRFPPKKWYQFWK